MNHDFFLGFSVFIACLVEMVEALTIVLALGITRGWKSVLLATIAAIATLGIIIAAFGTALTRVSDEAGVGAPTAAIRHLWLIVGALLLIFGLQWIRKGVLRAAQLLPSRDEDKAFEELKHRAQGKATVRKHQTIDWYSFVLAYKGVLLEGLEVVFIVIAFGAAQGNLHLGIEAAAAAFVVIAVLGALVHRPLARVPENTMKLAVGVLLTTFGTYFAARGIGVHWPHGDAAVWGILVFYIALVCGLIIWLEYAISKREPAA